MLVASRFVRHRCEQKGNSRPDVAAVCDMIEDTTRPAGVFRVSRKRELILCEARRVQHDLLAELWFASIGAQLRE